MMQNNDTGQDIEDDDGEGECEDTGETTLSSDIQEDDLDHQQQVLLLCRARRDKSSRTRMVPLPEKRSRADPVMARLVIPNPRKPPGSMVPPLFKR